jgi:DNA adenine methylase
MQYLGGKARLGGQIVSAILTDLGATRLSGVVDLCAGAGGVTHQFADVSDRVVAVEAHPGLVALHRALQARWVPPENVSEEEYRMLRRGNPADPLVAFAEFGCSFGGKSWGGYARNVAGNAGARNYAMNAKRALLKDVRQNVDHIAADALTWEPYSGLTVAYCDPPYAGTTGYAAVSPCKELGAWWRKMRSLADRGIAAFLSEYADVPPLGIAARLVWSAPTREGLRPKGARIERLWRILPADRDAMIERHDGLPKPRDIRADLAALGFAVGPGEAV